MLVIGDVCGKGAEAASVTALARHTLRAVSTLGMPPAAMLELLHRTLRAAGARRPDVHGLSRAWSDRAGRARELTIALAGHPRPLIVGPGERAFAVGEPGTVLGMVDPITVSEVSAELCDGQTLLLYTDGVPEAARARAGGALAPEELSARCTLALQDMLQAIETAAVESADGKPQDDIALLGLRLSRT